MGWAAAVAAARGARPRSIVRAARPEIAGFSAFVFAAAMFAEPVLGNLTAQKVLAEPSELLRLFWVPVYLALAPTFLLDWRRILACAVSTPLLLALAFWAVASVAWSVAPDVSVRRVFGLVVTMAFGWRLALMSWTEMLRVAASAFLALGVASLALVALWPAGAIMGPATEHPGAWSGVWPHKNLLGNLMGIAVAVFAAAALADRQRRLLWLLGGAVATVLIVKSTSATALVIAVIGLGSVAFGAVFRRGRTIAVLATGGALLACAAAAFLIAAKPDVFFDALGRDTSFTGRTDIWANAVTAIEKRPFLGYGFGAFWEGKEGPAFFLRSALGWAAPNAHSGWLDLALSVGLPGVALFATQLSATAWRLCGALPDRAAGLYAPGIVAVFVLLTITEGYLLQEHNLVWGLYVAIAAKLAFRSDGQSKKAEPVG